MIKVEDNRRVDELVHEFHLGGTYDDVKNNVCFCFEDRIFHSDGKGQEGVFIGWYDGHHGGLKTKKIFPRHDLAQEFDI